MQQKKKQSIHFEDNASAARNWITNIKQFKISNLKEFTLKINVYK